MSKNIAVIGCGYWGKNLIRNFSTLDALHTICDTNSDLLKKIVEQYSGIKPETDLRKILENPDIQGIVISTPAINHYSMAKEALIAGKDVFVEKPLSLKVAEGRELVELAEKNNRILMVGHLLEYHPAMVKLKEMIDSGELGKLRYIYSNRLNLGKLRTEENVLWSFAPHDISVILLLLNGQMPHTIMAHGGYYLHHDIADITLTTLDFDDGVKAHIFVNWLNPVKEQRLVVIGEKAMVEFNDALTDKELTIYRHQIDWVNQKPVPNPGEGEAIEVSLEEPLLIECRDFVRSLENRQQPKVDGKKGLQVLEILSYCQESLEKNGESFKLVEQEGEIYTHETSIVEELVEIGKGTKIWHFCHIMSGAVIGEDCTIGQNIFIGRNVKIGNNVKLENNVSVFEDVTLEDDVFCGPSCIFTNVINPRSHISRKNEFKPTLVKKGASIGANATIICGNTIGRYAFVGAGAVVTKDIPDYAMVYGNPARIHDWVCQCGNKLHQENGELHCIECGDTYNLKGTICYPIVK